MRGSCGQKPLIGELLVERGLVTSIQLEQALALQKTASEHEYIGDILVRGGYVTEMDIVTALVLQCHLPYISVSRYDVAPEVRALVPSHFAWRHRLVPLDKVGHVLSVVMRNPLEVDARREIGELTRCQIATFISNRSEIEIALKRFYGQEEL
jgi:type IV pilus assembly protein PilB